MTPRHVLGVAAGALALTMAGPLWAWRPTPPPGPPPSSPLFVTGTPVFGGDAPVGNGWIDVAAHLENRGPTPLRGTVSLSSGASWSADPSGSSSRSAFFVPPGRSAMVRLPMHGTASYFPSMTLRVEAEDGSPLAIANVHVQGVNAPLLVELQNPPRLAAALRGVVVTPTWDPGSRSSGAMVVGTIAFDPTTGDPVVPDRAVGYAPVSALLVPSDRLVRLPEETLLALRQWVRAGGTLAIIPSRPEDLRSAVLTSFVGGPVERTAAPAVFDRLPAGAKTTSPGPGLGPETHTPPEDPEPGEPPEIPPGGSDDDNDVQPIAFAPYVPAAKAHAPTLPVGPPGSIRGLLAGYRGGSLRPTGFGASTPYGLGEVHVLGFDPEDHALYEEPWIHGRLADLVERAWDRRSLNVFHLGAGDPRSGVNAEIRKALDPNENFRPALAVAALLLAAYAVLGVPLVFLRGSRKGDALFPLRWAPVVSVGVFGAIVFVGFAGKGWRGRARHLSLIETASASPEGAVRRFRGFYASRAETLRVEATDGSALLDVASADENTAGQGTLRVDRGKVSLEDLPSLPWQTVVVREDGIVNLGAGVKIRRLEGDDVRVENLLDRGLKDLLVWVPGHGVYLHPALPKGASLKGLSGRLMVAANDRAKNRAGSATIHNLGTYLWNGTLGNHDAQRLGQAWRPLESAAGDGVDWFPDARPVVLAEMDDDGHGVSDSGLRLESSRAFLRVIGLTKGEEDSP